MKMRMKVCFETFGCRLSRAEALDQEAQYVADGWEATESHEAANLIIVRGCSVTQRAQRDSERLVAHIRKKYPFKKVIVTGCIPEAKNKGVGTSVAGFETWGGAGVAKSSTIDSASGTQAPKPIPTRTARAYLKIQDGCAGQCTFCIVPKFRGSSVSVDFDAVTDRAKRFIDAGYHEIVVTGCNLSLYASQGKRLPELLAALSELSPDCRIRLGSLEPSDVAREVIDVIAARSTVCRFLHIPIQSGSNRILVAMKRPYFVRDVNALLKAAKTKLPNVALGCDLMTGFPGEVENDLIATKLLLESNPFSRVHVFPYSERPGTRAEKFPGSVDPMLRKERAKQLSDIGKAKRASYARRFLGHTVEIIVEDEKKCAGWTSEYLWCVCPHAKGQKKSPRKVRVISVERDVLIGAPA